MKHREFITLRRGVAARGAGAAAQEDPAVLLPHVRSGYMVAIVAI
jgi:hypothetical protein